MQPLICFYKDDLFFHSTSYLRLDEISIDFISYFQDRYPLQTKILQINFDSSTMTAFILLDFKLVSRKDLTTDLKDLDLEFSPQIPKESFIQKVKTIKQDIQMGRYYQVNLTSSFSAHAPTETDVLEIFKYYFQRFQSPYAAFLPLAQSEILCFSPELFLEKIGSRILTCPIKGTLKKSENFETILKDKKENAELSMIVDLLRNDLQSVCEAPVKVDQHRKELNLNYVTHTYSQISGNTNLKITEILTQMLPAGSISGCPKKESLKAIAELEETPRGFYTGCIGWLQGDDFKLSLAIRSFLHQLNKLTYFSGCGIVYDSDPEKEWDEFHHKARHLWNI